MALIDPVYKPPFLIRIDVVFILKDIRQVLPKSVLVLKIRLVDFLMANNGEIYENNF